MTTRYTHTTEATVIAVACLLDMQPNSGTINALNEMRTQGRITGDETYGAIAYAYTEFQQAKLLGLNDGVPTSQTLVGANRVGGKRRALGYSV